MTRHTICFLMLIGFASGVHAANQPSEGTTKFLAPFLDDQVVLIARIDVTKIDLDGFFKLDGLVTERGGARSNSSSTLRQIFSSNSWQLGEPKSI